MKKTLVTRMRQGLKFLKGLDAMRLLVLGYGSYVFIGWALLCLPFCQGPHGVGVLDNLFTSTSAVSTTGLVTVSTSDEYNFLGQLVILLLIQFGGLGYMTISSFLILTLRGEISFFRQRISTATLSLPEGFQLKSFLRTIALFTIAIETLGAIVLYFPFRAHGAPNPAWQAIFHSVSAFCTAGFGLFNNSFESYRGDVWLNLVIMVLSYLGAIGFIVLDDVWRYFIGLKKRITLTSKIIIACTLWITVIGTFLFAIDEPTCHSLPAGERWMTALFQVGTATTTVGFNTLPIGGLSASSLFLLTVIMIIGASPSGTGGGLKTTTFTALWAAMKSVIDRREKTVFLGREIPSARVRAAVANLVFYLLTLAAGIYALTLVEKTPFADQMFECASALGTVGLSRGITGGLTAMGKLIIIALMFVGRVGPVVLGFAVFQPLKSDRETGQTTEDVAI